MQKPVFIRLILAGLAVTACAAEVTVSIDTNSASARFAADEIRAAASRAKAASPLAVTLRVDATSLPPQGYRFTREADKLTVTGGDAAGAMYGGLDVAEAIRIGTAAELKTGEHRPFVEKRGIKFNIPLDRRTPSYSDNSTAFQANIPEMWSTEFWHAYLDEMARQRYNVLSLWSLHPFPSMVKVPEFPDVALNDVWRTKPGANYNSGTNRAATDYDVVKKISIDGKIAFWREVMQYAQDRGIAVYVFTWNIFTHGATGKYGITDSIDNPTTVAYTRASVRELVKTYPLLAGIGITAGEHMPSSTDVVKENWLWATYGEGVRDALRESPKRTVHMIHRFHQTGFSAITNHWKDYPGPFDFSFKYSIAHMYSVPNPSMVKPALELLPAPMKMWLTVRNDDIYTFRFGDPDFMRDYVANMPPAAKLGGFYMGADGYCLGREFLDRDPVPGPRQLVIEKQWYSFMLMGRLSFDPTLSDAHFERVLGARFPGVKAHDVYRGLRSASQTMPLITRFFWGDIDVRWFPEASWSKPSFHGYYTVKDFAEGQSMPGAGVLNIRQWRSNLIAKRPMTGVTPLQIADALQGAAREAMEAATALRKQTPAANPTEYRKTLVDIESLAWLGNYYAEKIRGACGLALYDLSRDRAEQASAVRHLENALGFWKRYAAVRDAQYLPALYNRVGYVDISALTKDVEADLTIARGWQPGSVREKVPGQSTEAGFSK